MEGQGAALATPLVLLAMSHLANAKLRFHSPAQPALTFPTLRGAEQGSGGAGAAAAPLLGSVSP